MILVMILSGYKYSDCSNIFTFHFHWIRSTHLLALLINKRIRSEIAMADIPENGGYTGEGNF